MCLGGGLRYLSSLLVLFNCTALKTVGEEAHGSENMRIKPFNSESEIQVNLCEMCTHTSFKLSKHEEI